jgi:hypothetical protein
MQQESKIAQIVKMLNENTKADLLKSIDEANLRKGIVELLKKMESTAYIELYHGQDEYGKDIVVIRKSPFGDNAIAIVVVRGDIRTKSSGLVDKIKSQVEQCFLHPAILESIKGQTKISFVWVMVAGTLSKGASIRLIAEINRPNVQIYDLKWLVDNFTQYYPYIFFESSISEYIEDKINELEKQHILSEKINLLTDYYVPNQIGELDKIIEISPDAMFSIVTNISSIRVLEQEIKAKNKILLVGEPGVGKSTALNKLGIDMFSKTLEAAAKKESTRLEIPLIIKARNLIEVDSVDSLLNKFGPPEQIKEKFEINALMVDALDEAPGNTREELMTKAIKFADTLKCALLITSRKIDIVKKESLGLTKRELMPMEFGQALTLFSRLVTDKKKLASLKDGLIEVQGQLSLTPLTLLLMIDLVNANNEIPSSVTLLYNKFFDLALGSEDKTRKNLDVLFNPEIKKGFLEELAFQEIFSKNRDRIKRSEFDDFLEWYANQQQWDADELRNFAIEIERAGILEIKDYVNFAHGTFLDYFIALRIYENREDIPELNDYLSKLYFDEWWYDVVFYYAGLKKKIHKSLINRIIDYDDGQPEDIGKNVSKVLVGRLLQAAWQSDAENKTYGIKKSLEYCAKVRECFLDFTKTIRQYANYLFGFLCSINMPDCI